MDERSARVEKPPAAWAAASGGVVLCAIGGRPASVLPRGRDASPAPARVRRAVVPPGGSPPRRFWAAPRGRQALTCPSRRP